MPVTTAGAIIVDNLNSPGKVLLTKRNIPPFKDQWCFPGGHIENYETAADAVIREVKEETGLLFQPRFLHYFDEIFENEQIHYVVLMYYGICSGSIKIQESEVTDIKWFSIDKAKSLNLAFGHNHALACFCEQICSNK